MFGRKSSDDYINDANKDITQGYNQAEAYESPYTTYGSTDFDNARSYLYKSLSGRKNYNDNFIKYLDMSPEDMLNEALSSYTESPMAKEEATVSMDAENNALTNSGLNGSPENELLDAEIGNTIFNQDESHYENQLMQALGIQSNVLKGYDKQTSSLMKQFQDLLGMESNSADTMASNAMRAGTAGAQADERGAMDNSRRNIQPIKGIASILGSLGGVYEMGKIGKSAAKIAAVI